MKAYLSYSLDDAVRYKASSGGFCKQFIRYCLENKIVDKAIITILGDGTEALIPNTIITNDIGVITSTKSNTIYDKTNPLSILRELSGDESYVFVGLPCHIKPFKRYCEKKQIEAITISLFCNHTSTKYFKSILDRLNLTEKDVEHFEYRGSGWAGSVKIIVNGKEIMLDHHECWKYYMDNYYAPLNKCKKCTKPKDADICVGDAWIPEIINSDKKGTCIVLSTNSNADKLINECSDEGYIYLNENINDER